jgi:hypothetical protein
MSDFKFFCPECGQKIAYDEAYSGQPITCPACQKPVVAPPVLITAAIAEPAMAGATRSSASNFKTSPERQPASSPAPARTAIPATADAVSNANPPRVLALGFPCLALTTLVAAVWFAFRSIPIVILVWIIVAFVPVFFFCIGDTRSRRLSSIILKASCAGFGLLLLFLGVAVFTQHYLAPRIVVRESQAELDALKSRIVDEVLIGRPSEQEHQLHGKYMQAGPFNGRFWRAAIAGGSIIYVMKVLPDQPMSLNCRYWGGEQRGRTFDLCIDDKVIATQDLDYNVPGHFFDAEYRIPRSLTSGKTEVTVKFQAHPGVAAGGLFGCQILKR